MKNGFDKLAAPYRWMEYLSFGRALERCRFHFLSTLSDTRNALLLGDGDGRFTAALLQQAPAAQAFAVDNSAAMLKALQQRCERNGTTSRLTIHQADLRKGLRETLMFTGPTGETTHRNCTPPSCAEHTDGYRAERDQPIKDRHPERNETESKDLLFPPHPERMETFDLIATHFLLDCLTDPQVDRLVADTTARSAPGAQWIISEFRIPPAGPMRLVSLMIVRSLYTAFRLLTSLRTSRLPDHETVLRQYGWHLVERQLSLGGILTSERWRQTGGSSPEILVPKP